MSDEVKAIPDGYERVTPYLTCKNAEKAIDFYTKAFGAKELFRIGSPGMIGHAELKIGDSIIMLADEHPDMGILSPETIGGTPVGLMIYVEDVDTFAEKAIAEGLKVERPIEDQFYGDRSGHFVDPFGHKWTFSTHIKDVSPDEMNQKAKEMYG